MTSWKWNISFWILF